MNKLINRIKKQKKVEYTLFGSVPLTIKDELTNDIHINQLIKRLESLLPTPPKGLLKSILVGQNSVFDKRNVNALYHGGILYISNEQNNLNDMLDDIVHEYSHALEEVYGKEIYSDDSIKDEFLLKRLHLEKILRHSGFNTFDYDFENIIFDQTLDNFLLNVVGYEKFKKLTNYGLFVIPYAATSLREYFATGFEEYILGDHQELQNISPDLYFILKELF